MEKLPAIDNNTLLIVQAGNVNSGAFDPIDTLCAIANKAGAWVHVDGAFGLWAAASGNLRGLTKGIKNANSWSPEASNYGYLGKSGVQEIVDRLCVHAKYFAQKLSENGFVVLNDVVFNQILIKCETFDMTNATLKNIQSSGKCWCGGAVWQDEPVIRVSVCSWQTTKEDIDDCIDTFINCRERTRKT